MSRKILTTVSILVFFSLSPSTFAGEMERFDFNSNYDKLSYTKKIRGNQLSSPLVFDPLPKSHFSNPIIKTYMEPISQMTTRWHSGVNDYMQKQFNRSFVNSVLDPSDLYVGRKLKNDLYKTANTMVSVGTAAVGGPLAKIGAVANVIHNFGPQTGKIQDISGDIGDVAGGVSAVKTAIKVFHRDFSNLEPGVIGIVNTAFGKITDAHKITLRQPFRTSATEHYRLGSNDGFTKTQRIGTITATKTFTPPKTVKTFGPPGIFEGNTTKIVRKHEVVTTKTGNFQPVYKSSIFRTPNLNNSQRPPFTGHQTFKMLNLYIGRSFTNPAFSNTTFQPPSFKSPSFRIPTFQAPSFGKRR